MKTSGTTTRQAPEKACTCGATTPGAPARRGLGRRYALASMGVLFLVTLLLGWSLAGGLRGAAGGRMSASPATADGAAWLLDLPWGHPRVRAGPRLPPGHPPVHFGRELPGGNAPWSAAPRLPAGHPPLGVTAGDEPAFPPGFLTDL